MNWPAAAVCCVAVLAITRAQTPTLPWPVRLTDVAEKAGLTHPSVYGETNRKRFIIETNGCGSAFVDFDRDGWMDALVLSGTRLEPNSSQGTGLVG